MNPIFTWVRLAQRIAVRIEITDSPDGVVLVPAPALTSFQEGIALSSKIRPAPVFESGNSS